MIAGGEVSTAGLAQVQEQLQCSTPRCACLPRPPPPLAQDLRILAGNTVGIAWGAFLSLSCVNAASGL